MVGCFVNSEKGGRTPCTSIPSLWCQLWRRSLPPDWNLCIGAPEHWDCDGVILCKSLRYPNMGILDAALGEGSVQCIDNIFFSFSKWDWVSRRRPLSPKFWYQKRVNTTGVNINSWVATRDILSISCQVEETYLKNNILSHCYICLGSGLNVSKIAGWMTCEAWA